MLNMAIKKLTRLKYTQNNTKIKKFNGKRGFLLCKKRAKKKLIKKKIIKHFIKKNLSCQNFLTFFQQTYP